MFARYKRETIRAIATGTIVLSSKRPYLKGFYVIEKMKSSPALHTNYNRSRQNKSPKGRDQVEDVEGFATLYVGLRALSRRD